MKTISPFLLRFALTVTVLTITFRYFLSHGVKDKSLIITLVAAILYGVIMFISGWFFGRRDVEYFPIYDVGFRFHLAAFLIYNIVSLSWFVLGFNAHDENINIIYATALIWGAILITHFFFFLCTRKNSINNLYKKDLFE